MSEPVDPARSGLDRMSAFSDGVFAIAITLLVLPLTEVQYSPANLLDVLRELASPFFAFVLSFAVIGRYWLSHHDDVRWMTGVDRRLLVLNLVFLFFVVLLPFPTAVLGEAGGATATVLYAATIELTALSSLGLWLHARRAGLTDHAGARERTVRKTAGTVALALAFLPSFALAAVSPTWAQLSWTLVFPFSALADRVAARRLP